MCKKIKYPRFTSLLACCLLSCSFIAFSGCKSSTQKAGTIDKRQTESPATKVETSVPAKDFDQRKNEVVQSEPQINPATEKNPEIKEETIVVSSSLPDGKPMAPSPTPPPDTTPVLTPSKLGWNGVTAIGTTQLFLIPVE